MPGDYDGDGKADVALFRPSLGRWFIESSIDGSATTADWCLSGDTMVPADFDGDGKADIAVFRPSTGFWSVRGLFNRSWGAPGDKAGIRSPDGGRRSGPDARGTGALTRAEVSLLRLRARRATANAPSRGPDRPSWQERSGRSCAKIPVEVPMSIPDWIRMGLVPALWGLIAGGAAAGLAVAIGVDDSLARGIGMLTTIAVTEGLRRLRDAVQSDDPSMWGSSPDPYEEPESAPQWRLQPGGRTRRSGLKPPGSGWSRHERF